MVRLSCLVAGLFLVCPGLITAADPPPVAREFRGVWVATVANIDWPSRKGLSTQQQQAELRAILDKVVALNLNAVVLQVRPMTDALYASPLEPWSEYLTGKLGQAPEPFYDPLEFVIKEAHARGLELHAWFNPYRSRHPSATSASPANHLQKSRPDLAKPYGKHYWLNPTHPEVQEHSLKVFLDVVRRYDVDGIHMDDYFYPYKEKDAAGNNIPFPDDDTWAAYQKNGGKLSRDDWRRAGVNTFVERLYKETKALKPWVKVGISPFGIWRPGNPPGIAGLDQYAELYADAKLWLNKGWVDYFTPQLYWPIKREKQSYPKLLAWWASENTMGRHLWPGNIVGRNTGGKDSDSSPTEIADQVRVTRAQKGASGNIFFSMKSLQRNTGKVNDLLATVYAEPALVPASPWLSDKKPTTPKVAWDGNGVRITAGDGVRFCAVRCRQGDAWTLTLRSPESLAKGVFAVDPACKEVQVFVLDRFSTASELVSLKR